MEVLQCDGCDFRAESYDELKTHIQEVHTAFLQPADADESDSLKDEDEDEEEEEDCQDKDDRDDKDYTPSKAGTSRPNHINSDVTVNLLRIRKHLFFLFQGTLYSRMIVVLLRSIKIYCTVAGFIENLNLGWQICVR